MNEQPTLAPYQEQLLGDLLAFQTARSPEPALPHADASPAAAR